MAHDCLECGELCYCDMEDTMMPTPLSCSHQCDHEHDDD